ncbi:MAG TPA: GNAT family N-acetyltransferase [Mycobacteriales bacterium]|nr:GNAT family N-acetyltransferase [Mycobacteriales bacterium]HVX69305.1 GNAT family N-acetyltransferase [Mycobacteriales bacterium]
MIRFAHVDAARMRALAGPAASVYGAAMARSPEVVVQRRDIIAGHTAYPGFIGAAAFDIDEADVAAEGELVGFGYGYLGASGQWWHDTVAHALGRDGAKRWLRDGFELAELHVLPGYQGGGLGRHLLTDVLSRTTARHAVLSTPDTESPARLLYRSYGFEDLVCNFYFPGSSECYAIMGIDL